MATHGALVADPGNRRYSLPGLAGGDFIPSSGRQECQKVVTNLRVRKKTSCKSTTCDQKSTHIGVRFDCLFSKVTQERGKCREVVTNLTVRKKPSCKSITYDTEGNHMRVVFNYLYFFGEDARWPELWLASLSPGALARRWPTSGFGKPGLGGISLWSGGKTRPNSRLDNRREARVGSFGSADRAPRESVKCIPNFN